MVFILFLVIISFLTIMQAAIPFLLKKSVVFGVTIPEENASDPVLANYKKTYSAIIFLSGLIGLIYFMTFSSSDYLDEETVVFRALLIQFLLLLISMVLYLIFHVKTTNRKRDNNWGSDLKKVRIADLSTRSADEMLPSLFFVLPIFITIGLIAYTGTQYSIMPDLIPTHWGPNGTPDAFSEKNPFSVVALLLILLTMQLMMLSINIFTKKSGIKLNVAKRNSSRIQQLTFRKYTSWLLFFLTILLTILFGFFQLTTIHSTLVGHILMMTVPLGSFVIILLITALYAFKVGQGGARVNVEVIDQQAPGLTDTDEDTYWKAGVFYVNRKDPSIFVEKRFGVGWTLNFGNPIGYLVIFIPLIIILVISLLL